MPLPTAMMVAAWVSCWRLRVKVSPLAVVTVNHSGMAPRFTLPVRLAHATAGSSALRTDQPQAGPKNTSTATAFEPRHPLFAQRVTADEGAAVASGAVQTRTVNAPDTQSRVSLPPGAVAGALDRQRGRRDLPGFACSTHPTRRELTVV